MQGSWFLQACVACAAGVAAVVLAKAIGGVFDTPGFVVLWLLFWLMVVAVNLVRHRRALVPQPQVGGGGPSGALVVCAIVATLLGPVAFFFQLAPAQGMWLVLLGVASPLFFLLIGGLPRRAG